MTTAPLSPRQRELLAMPQWSWLTDVVRTWYAAPLSAADGVEDMTGAVPGPLADWFSLVGNRLYRVQDEPVTPESAVPDTDRPGLWTVWTENQGCWSLFVDPADQCRSDDDDIPFGPCPLHEALRCLVLSETLVGAWGGKGVGPLGALSDAVAGGLVEDAAAGERAGLADAYPTLDLAEHPVFPGIALRGNDITLVRDAGDGGFGLEWATASEEARMQVDTLVPLDPPEGVHFVEVAFEKLPLDKLEPLFGDSGDVGGRALDSGNRGSGFGWLTAALSTASSSGDEVGELWAEQSTRGHHGTGSASCSIRTRDVDAVVAAVDRGLASLPPILAAKVVIAARPERMSRFTVLRPEGRSGYKSSL